MKLTAFASLLTLIIVTQSTVGYTQDRRQSNEEDPGVDVAVVIATRANLREGPTTQARS